nr:MAG: hypothetical protein [Molluscum contagiosum virus]
MLLLREMKSEYDFSPAPSRRYARIFGMISSSTDSLVFI